MSIPDWLDELGAKELGKQWDTEIKALNQQADVVLRANTLKTTKKGLHKALLGLLNMTLTLHQFKVLTLYLVVFCN